MRTTTGFLFVFAGLAGLVYGATHTTTYLTVIACTSGLIALIGAYHETLVNRLSAIEAKIDYAAEKTEEGCDVCKH